MFVKQPLLASFSLQILPLLTPMSRNWHGVPVGLEVDQELGVVRVAVVETHHVWPRNQLKHSYVYVSHMSLIEKIR